MTKVVHFKIGDKVYYDGVLYTIEKDYGNNVYFIGNEDSYVDMVNVDCLILESLCGVLNEKT